MRSAKALGFAVAAAVAAGCGGEGPETGPVKTQPVSGQVIYDGKPAAGVKVTFFPESAPMIPRIPENPRGVTGSDGRFTLSTYADGDGAGEGGYQVLMTWPRTGTEGDADVELSTEGNDRLLGWYDATHSAIRVRVKEGQNTLEPFNLPKKTTPPPPAQGVPGRN